MNIQHLGIVLGIVVLSVGPLGCSEWKKGFDEGYCKSFAESFQTSCTNACAGGDALKRDPCAAACKEELPKQGAYRSRCIKDEKSAR